jgi:hypothetical protein
MRIRLGILVLDHPQSRQVNGELAGNAPTCTVLLPSGGMASRVNSTTVPPNTIEAFDAPSQGGTLVMHPGADAPAGRTTPSPRLRHQRIIADKTPP